MMEEDFLSTNPFIASRGRTNRGTDLPNLFANAAMLGNLPIDVAMNAAASALQGISPIQKGPFDAFTEMGGPNFQNLLHRAEIDPITGLPVTPQIQAEPFMSHPDRDIRDSIQLVGIDPESGVPGRVAPIDEMSEIGGMGPQLNYMAQQLASGAPRLTPMGNPMLREIPLAGTMGTQRIEYPIRPDIKDDPNRSRIARFFGYGDVDPGLQRNPGVLNPSQPIGSPKIRDDVSLFPAYGGDFDMNLPPHLRPKDIPMDTVGSQEMGPQDTFRQGGTAEKIEDGQVVRARKPGQFFDVTPDEHLSLIHI